MDFEWRDCQRRRSRQGGRHELGITGNRGVEDKGGGNGDLHSALDFCGVLNAPRFSKAQALRKHAREVVMASSSLDGSMAGADSYPTLDMETPVFLL